MYIKITKQHMSIASTLTHEDLSSEESSDDTIFINLQSVTTYAIYITLARL
mgnify:CR=1 FL=1